MAEKKDERVENEDVMRKLMDKPTISEVLKELCSRLDRIEDRLNLLESQVSNLKSKSDTDITDITNGDYWYTYSSDNTSTCGDDVSISDTEDTASVSTIVTYSFDASALQFYDCYA